jgi:hypothetical protein
LVNWDQITGTGTVLRIRNTDTGQLESFSAGSGTGATDPNYFTDPEYGGSYGQYNEPTPRAKMCVLPIISTILISSLYILHMVL